MHHHTLNVIQPKEAEHKKTFNLNPKLLDIQRIASDRNVYAHQCIDKVYQQKYFVANVEVTNF